MIVLKIVGIIFGSLIAVIIVYLVTIIFLPVLQVKKVHMLAGQDITLGVKQQDGVEAVSFEVDGDRIDAKLFLPIGTSEPVSCVVMSNGFGGTRGMILEQYAIRFQKAGIASLLYDYRGFGSSEGHPRQLYSMVKQLDDLIAAIEYARQRDEIDAGKIALWGTSAAGGYGLIKASEDKDIACIIGQCPSLDTKADGEIAVERLGVAYFIKMFMHAQRDKGRSRFGLSAHTIPIVAKEGQFAFLNAPGAYEGYSSLVDATFVNEVCARSMIEPSKNPVDYASGVECPVLLLICEKDNLVSEKSYKNAKQILGELATVKKYPIGHFDIYKGDNFEAAVRDQIEFLERHLK